MTGFLAAWLASFPGFMTPLLLASVGLILCERAGILNLGSEGLMAVGAMTGAVVALSGAGPWLALALGAFAGLAIAVPFILAVVVLRAPQIPAGLALVAIGLGASAAFGRAYAHKPFVGLRPLDLPEVLTGLPLIGRMLFAQDGMVYLSLIIALGAGTLLMRSNFGLRLRAVGEDPATADAAGVDVQVHQLIAVVAGCFLIALAGAYLSVGGSQIWTEGMVAGRGWIALALVVFARWSPARAVLGAILFGGAEAAIPRLQTLGLPVPVYFLSMTPYLLTIAVLVAFALLRRGGQGEPGFLGRAYIRQDR